MTITKQDINAVLTRLTQAFPQAFVLEQYQPHRPLKVEIFSEIAARCPDLARSDLVTALNIYTRRMMYLQSLVASGPRRPRRHSVRRGNRRRPGTRRGQAGRDLGCARGQARRGSRWDADRETGSSCGSGVGYDGADTEGKASAASAGNQSVASRSARANALACSSAAPA